MRFLPIAAASLLLASCASVGDTGTQTAIVTSPNVDFIRGDITYLSSDALEGRQAGERGFETASTYVANRYEAIGLAPGGTDGSWFQPVRLRTKHYGDIAKNTLELSGPKAIELTQVEDVLVTGRNGVESGTIEAPLVFVGQGYVDPRHGRDDLAGIDLTGKIAVALGAAPEYLNPEEAAYFKSTRTERLAKAGAVGIISLSTKPEPKPEDEEAEAAKEEAAGVETAETPAEAEDKPKKTRWDGTKHYFMHYVTATWVGPDGEGFGPAKNLAAYAVMRDEPSERLMAGQPLTLEAAKELLDTEGANFRPFDMGMTARMSWDQDFEYVESRNVVGMVEGTDPALKNEYVVLTAHLDHVGLSQDAEKDDKIYNGAMDNASGVGIMLDVARRLAINPPRRSVLFIALTAEEMGLVGSSYNAHYPTVPAGSVVANVNMDMPVLTYDFVDAVAFGAERSTLLPVVEAATSRAGVKLVADPKPEEAFFTRSDHYSYVEMGIPSVYLDTGPGNGGEAVLDKFLEEHYHGVSDEAGLIDFDQAARFADINYEISRGIANMDERPVWYADDFFGRVFNGPTDADTALAGG